MATGDLGTNTGTEALVAMKECSERSSRYVSKAGMVEVIPPTLIITTTTKVTIMTHPSFPSLRTSTWIRGALRVLARVLALVLV